MIAIVIAAAAAAGGEDAAWAQPAPDAPTESEPARPSTIAVYVEGREANVVRKQILQLVPKEVHVVDAKIYRRSLTNSQIFAEMGGRLDHKNPRVRAAIEKQIRKANRLAKVEGAIIVKVRGGSAKGKNVYLVIVSAEPKTEPQEIVVASGDEGTATLRAAIGPYLKLDAERPDAAAANEPSAAELPPPAQPEAKPKPTVTNLVRGRERTTEERDEGAHAQQEAARAAPHRPLIGKLAGAVELEGRAFEYTAVKSANLRPYSALGQTAFVVSGEVFPATTSTVPIIRDLGLFADFERTLRFDTTVDKQTVGGSRTQLLAGAAARIRFGLQGPVVLLTGAFGWVDASFDEAGRLDAQLPTVTYILVRPGIDVGFTSGPVYLHVGGGYDAVLKAAGVSERFKQSSVRGFDAHGGLHVRLWGAPERAVNPTGVGLEGRLGVYYARYFYSFTTKPQDEYSAGGAYDELYGLSLGPGLVF